jgi:hypothetical protein
MMIDASQNYASDEIVDAIGLLYVNSLLWQSGLFDPRRGGGMWIGRYYAHPAYWTTPPCEVVKTRDGVPVTAGCSAAAGAAYMTLLHLGKLVNADASRRMKIFLDRQTQPNKGETLTGCFTAYTVVADHIATQKEAYAKIGIGNYFNEFEPALLAMQRGTKVYRYASCYLDADPNANPSLPLYNTIDYVPPPLPMPPPMAPPPPPPPAPPDPDDEDDDE